MGKSSASHGKKTDKETQSPLLKIFKEIMQKEHGDLEKATLVREKKKKKRKQHSSPQSKSDQKSIDSSGVERGRKDTQYTVAERNRAYSGTRTRSNPFPSEKRESWWLWGDSSNRVQKQPSTCSCVSCQLVPFSTVVECTGTFFRSKCNLSKNRGRSRENGPTCSNSKASDSRKNRQFEDSSSSECCEPKNSKARPTDYFKCESEGKRQEKRKEARGKICGNKNDDKEKLCKKDEGKKDRKAPANKCLCPGKERNSPRQQTVSPCPLKFFCRLKKILGSEYACIGCLAVLFIISVIFAFMIMCRIITIAPDIPENKDSNTMEKDSNSMRRKLEHLQSNVDKYPEYKKGDFGRDLRRSIWNDELKNLDASLSEHDFGENIIPDSDSQVQGGVQPASDLSSILDPNKFNNAQVSPRLRMFYKKLIETDAQIKNLKKGIYDNPTVTIVGNKNSLYRLKRSIFHHQKTTKKQEKTTATTLAVKDKAHNKKTEKTTEESPKEKDDAKTENKEAKPDASAKKEHGLLDGIIEIKDNVKKKKKEQKRRLKRFQNGTEPREIMFEKKQLIVQYMADNKPKFPKCSHAPKDYRLHEQRQKHPFYKNTQRLDELLDEFLDRNLHDIVSDQFGLESILGKPKKQKCQHTSHAPSTETTTLSPSPMPPSSTTSPPVMFPTERLYNKYLRPNVARAKKLKTELTKLLKSDNINPKRDYNLVHKRVTVDDNGDIEYVTSPAYDIVLSISTLINPAMYQKRATNYASDSLLSKLPVRKLMQSDDQDEESLAYEDLKEVLSDDMATHDETDRQVERKRRDDKTFDEAPPLPIKYNPPGVYNPNWKGPVPLYPDELNSMIKQMETVKTPTKLPISPSTRQPKTEANDIEYIEDYLTNKYENLVKMAQAYSDYGVLDGKKDTLKVEKTEGKIDRRIKMSNEDQEPSVTRVKRGPNFIFNTGSGEGFSVMVKPCQKSRDDDPKEFFKSISKHFKIHKVQKFPISPGHTTLVPVSPDIKIIYKPKHQFYSKDRKKEKDLDYYSNSLRTLQSLEFDANDGVVDLPEEHSNFTKEKSLPIENFNTFIMKGESKKPTNEAAEDSTFYFTFYPRTETNTNDELEVVTDNLVSGNSYESTPKSKIPNSAKDRIRRKRSVNLDINKDTGSEIMEPDAVKEGGLLSVNDVKTAIEELRGNSSGDGITKRNATDNEMGASEFFALLSNWFNTLAGVSEEGNSTQIDTSKQVLKLTRNATTKAPNVTNVTRDIVYPLYDSDMIDNIGHRSRVLLSFEDDHANVSDTSEGDSESVSEKSDTISTTVSDAKSPTANLSVIANETKRDDEPQTNNPQREKEQENKTVVKRSAPEEPNLVFWNDIYDDEYGIKIDPLDDNVGSKRSVSAAMVKKSAGWLQNKVRKMTDSIKTRSKESFNKFYKSKKNPLSGDFDDGLYSKDNLNNIYHKIVKREEEDDEIEDAEKKSSFAILTAHMQEVCKQASKAVQQTRNIRQNGNHQSELASGMMQQLIKLMSELVDFEVQQKTCLRLPDDLKDFLDWLTIPNAAAPEKQKAHNIKIVSQGEDHLLDLATTQSSEKEDERTDVRSECLGSLHAVQNLMHEYSQLSDEDKSKMGGVKEYLEDQLDYLSKQLSSIEEMNLANIYAKGVVPYRFRRDVRFTDRLRRRRPRTLSRRFKRKLRKFIKNTDKKHTRTTASSFENLQVSTEVYKKEKRDIINEKERDKTELKTENSDATETVANDGIEKRNLQDVYYKALEDAKKLTTVKSLHKGFVNAFYKDGVVRTEG